MSRQVEIGPARQGEVDDHRGIRGIGPGIGIRRGDFPVVDGGYDYRRDVRQDRRGVWDGGMYRQRT